MVRKLIIFMVILILSLSSHCQDYEFKKYLPGYDSVLVKVFLETQASDRDACISISSSPAPPVKLYKGQQRLITEYLGSATCDGTCADTLSIVELLIGDGHQVGNYDLPRNVINFISFNDKAAVVRTLPFITKDYGVHNPIIYTKDLHVGDTNIMRIIALSELYGEGLFNIMMSAGGSALSIYVTPYPIQVYQPTCIEGTARKIAFSWHEPPIPYWNLASYAILQSNDTIRVSNITNCQTIRANIPKSDTIQEIWQLKADQNKFYAIAGYDSLGEFIALSRSFRSVTDDTSFDLVQPADDEIVNSLNPSFVWENAGIEPFELWLSTDSLYTQVVKYTGLTGNSFSIMSNLDDHTIYYWKVMANDSSFSNQTQWRFKTNQNNVAPLIVNNLFPANGSTITSNPFKLQWDSALDPGDNLLYEILISLNQNMTDTVSLTTISNNWLIPSIDLPEDTLLWWVIKAIDSDGSYSITEPLNLIVSEEDYPDPFSLKSPDAFETAGIVPAVKGTETTTFPEFVWYRSLDSDPGSLIEYTLYYSTDSDFIEETTIIAALTDTVYSPVNPLTEDKFYYWKVKATDNTGRSTWSLGLPFGFMVNETDMPIGPIEILYPIENQNVPIGRCNPLVIDYPENDYFDVHYTHYTFFSNDSSFSTSDTLNTIAGIPSTIGCSFSGSSLLVLDTVGPYYVATQILSKKNTNPCYRYCEFNGSSTSDIRKFYLSDTAVFSGVMWQNSYWGEEADSVESTIIKTVSWHSIGVELVKLEYSLDNGISWILVDDSIPSISDQQNNAYFRIPYINESYGSLKIRIADMYNPRAYYNLLRTYTIIQPVGKLVQILLPDTNAQLKATSIYRIEFTKQKVDKVNLYYSIDGGLTYNEMITGYTESYYLWTVPDSVSDICLIKVEDYFYPEAFFLSGNFSITPCRRIHVALSGDDMAGDGTTTNPYRTVQKAITEFISYDSIKVASGVYPGLIDLDLFTGEVFRLSGGYDSNTWQISDIPTVFENQGGTIISKINLTPYRKYYFNGLLLQNAVYAFNIGTPTSSLGDAESLFLNNIDIQSCSNAIFCYRTNLLMDGVSIKNCANGIIIYNFFVDNLSQYSNCIFDSITGYAVNISRWNPVNHHFTNCTFNNCTYGIYGDNPYYCHLNVSNSIFANNGTSINYTSVIANVNDYKYNLFYNNTIDLILNTVIQQPDSTNILGIDPAFNTSNPGLFLLDDLSPCIGAGSLNSLTTDYYGNPRPNPTGSNPDIGAFESLLGNPQLTISGTIAYNNLSQTPMDSVDIGLVHNGTTIDTTLSDTAGHYHFLNPADGIYQLELSSIKSWGGVNATDALKVQRHAVGIELITEPVRLNAADVNNSSAINATDALQIKRRTVGLMDSFSRGDWTFAKPGITGDTIIVNGLSVYQNFNALCVGDVNGSNLPDNSKMLSQSITPKHDGTIKFEPDASISVPVLINNQVEVGAITLWFRLPDDTTIITSVTTNAGETTWQFSDNILSVAWSSIAPLDLNMGDTLLLINLYTSQPDNFIIDLLPGGELADSYANPIPDVTLLIPEIVSVQQPNHDQFNVKIYPNPASDFLWITFTLEKTFSSTIKLNDLAGACLQEIRPGNLSTGSHSYKFNMSSVKPGTYIICLELSSGGLEIIKCTKNIVFR